MRDKEWLKNEITSMFTSAYELGKIEYYESEQTIERLSELIDQLDEPETLSQEWIDENKVARIKNVRKMTTSDVVPVEKLESILVPKQELPVIPNFVAEWIEASRYAEYHLLGAVYDGSYSEDMKKWLFRGDKRTRQDNQDKLARAWLDGYEVEKEPVYYAKIKGHELVETETILDEDTGEDVSEYYRNVYFVLQRNGELVIDMKDSGLSGAKHVMTMNQWNDLGVNETNADFEEVTQCN